MKEFDKEKFANDVLDSVYSEYKQCAKEGIVQTKDFPTVKLIADVSMTVFMAALEKMIDDGLL